MFKDLDNWKEVAEELNIPTCFGIDVENNDTAEIDDIFYKVETKYGLNRANGCTKVALINSEWDDVLKIGFNGQWSYREIYDDATGEYEWNDEPEWADYTEAEGYDHSDYATTEWEMYNELEEAGFGIFMAATELIYKDKNGRNFFIQEKVRSYSDYGTSRQPSKESREKVEKMKSMFGYGEIICNVIWDALAIDYYGEEAYNAFKDFINNKSRYTWDSDLHCGNFGCRESDGSPCILDCSNFFDQ